MERNKELGLLHIEESTENGKKNHFEIIDKAQIHRLLIEMQKKSKLVYNEEDVEYMNYGWNDYLHVLME